MGRKTEKHDGDPMEAALRILNLRDHSEVQLRRKLMQRGFDTATISETLTRLKELAYIDDRRFARLVVRDRMAVRKRGMSDARAQLFKAGVDAEIIQETFEEMSDELDERRLCGLAAEKKLNTLREPVGRKRREKLARHLAGRGFSPDSVTYALDEFSERLHDEDTDDDLDG